METSLFNLLKPYEDISIAFQRYLLQVTNGGGNFIEFATMLSWRMQLGMVLEFLDIVYDVTISIFPNGGAVIKVLTEDKWLLMCIQLLNLSTRLFVITILLMLLVNTF